MGLVATKLVLFYSYNSAVVEILFNKQSSKDQIIMILQRKFSLKHIPGIYNVTAYLLFGLQISEAKSKKQTLADTPASILYIGHSQSYFKQLIMLIWSGATLLKRPLFL